MRETVMNTTEITKLRNALNTLPYFVSRGLQAEEPVSIGDESEEKISILIGLVKVVTMFNEVGDLLDFGSGFDAVSYNNQCIQRIRRLSAEVGILPA